MVSNTIDLRERSSDVATMGAVEYRLRQAMFSIQKLIGRDEKFYDLLEASAQQVDASVHHLIELLQKLEQHDTPENLEQFAHSRIRSKQTACSRSFWSFWPLLSSNTATASTTRQTRSQPLSRRE